MAALRCHLNCAKTKVTAQFVRRTPTLFRSDFASVHSAKSFAPTCVPSHGSNVVGNTFRLGDMCTPTRCYIATPCITMFAGRTGRGLGHGDPEDHRNVEQTTPLLGHRHRRACTKTVDDGVAAFFLEATHVHAGDVHSSVCDSVVVLSVFRVDASEMASGSVAPPLHLIGAATADGASSSLHREIQEWTASQPPRKTTEKGQA